MPFSHNPHTPSPYNLSISEIAFIAPTTLAKISVNSEDDITLGKNKIHLSTFLVPHV